MKTWVFAGTDLSDLGTIVQISDALKMAEKRSDNILVPMRDGRTHARKYYEQKIITLGLALIEEDAEALEDKLDLVKRLCGSRAQGLLQQVLANELVRQGYAEVRGSLGLSRVSPVALRLTIDFVVTDPFLRSNVAKSNTTTINAATVTYTLNNPGTADERHAVVTLNGPLSYPKVENLTNGVYVAYNGTIAAGHSVVINCEAMTAVDETGANVIGSIVHSGDTDFLVLLPGDNTMQVTDGVGTTGTVKIVFYPPFL